MNHEITIVKENPLRLLQTFPGTCLALPLNVELLLDLLCYGKNLTIVVADGNHEYVGYRQRLRHIEGHQVLGLYGVRRPRRNSHTINRILYSRHVSALP